MDEFDPIATLVARFPRLFRGRPPRVWSDLPSGWNELVTRMFNDIDSMMDDGQAKRFKVLQIKEKFAGLRVYWQLGEERTTTLDVLSPHNVERAVLEPDAPSALFERITARVDAAEAEAARTCQVCGSGRASLRRSGYWVKLCEPCEAARKS